VSRQLIGRVLAPLVVSVTVCGQVPVPRPLPAPGSPAGRPGITVVDLRKAGGPRVLLQRLRGNQGPVLPSRNYQPIDATRLANLLRDSQTGSPPTPSSPDPAAGSASQPAQAQAPAPLPAPTGTFVTLSPAEPFVTGKGWYSSAYPAWSFPSHLSFQPLPGRDTRLDLTIQSSGVFLVDFVVSILESGTVCTVAAAWSGAQQIAMNPGNDVQHLVVAMDIPPKPADVQTIDWVVRLECTRAWSFHSVTAFNAK